MATFAPQKGFAGADLYLHHVPIGLRFGRIFHIRHRDPLGFGKTPSRFSDERQRIEANRFGVLYLGETLKVCFLETVLRDRRDGVFGDLPPDERELHDRRYAEIEVERRLALIDLRGDGAVVGGIPTDVAKASDQRLARSWSATFHEHPQRPDGIIYPSRLNGQTCLAVYDRAVAKLRSVRTMALIAAPGLAHVLDDLKIAVIDRAR